MLTGKRSTYIKYAGHYYTMQKLLQIYVGHDSFINAAASTRCKTQMVLVSFPISILYHFLVSQCHVVWYESVLTWNEARTVHYLFL